MWRGGGNEELNTLAVKGMSDGKQYSPLGTCNDNQATGPGANIGQGKPLRRSHFVVVQADEEREDNVKEPARIMHENRTKHGTPPARLASQREKINPLSILLLAQPGGRSNLKAGPHGGTQWSGEPSLRLD
ncbi:hypothetical protein CIRG_09992 [Coccidioides immitis RMSCC 2394]|uniref:Uncharacterized protein n=1 Tax=Coccidioides immitis RMSCC 2394 TaxID=404692 RepID=A0A0J6Y669_COCIT|nr:hypothetical protein CIRG_09992 [Coccidioides immitis RMSCC 2394]